MRKVIFVFVFIFIFIVIFIFNFNFAHSLSAAPAGVSQTINLRTGFNFISFTLSPLVTPEAVIASNTAIEDIYQYSAAAGSFLSYSDGTLKNLYAGRGYIIKSRADTAVALEGEAVTAIGDIALKSGFNLIGVSRLPPSAASFSLLIKNSAVVSGLYKWSSSAGSFITVMRGLDNLPVMLDGTDPSFKAGEAYFINITSDTSINFDNDAIKFANIDIIVPNAAPTVGASLLLKNQSGGISLSYSFVDNDGDSDKSFISWYRNGVLVEGIDSKDLPSYIISNGDEWYAAITAYDGKKSGNSITSNKILISANNAPPVINNMFISRTPGLTAIRLAYEYSDADGDTDESIVRWYRFADGALAPALVPELTGVSVPLSMTAPNDRWTCDVIPFDGKDAGSLISSNVVHIVNEPPEFTVPSTLEATEDEAIEFSVYAYDPDTIDPSKLSYALSGGPSDKFVKIEYNRFKWQTGPGDFIDSSITVEVSDGIAKVVKTLPVKVNKKYAALRGYVRDILSGLPVGNAVVTFGSRSVFTMADGGYVLYSLPGTYIYSISHAQYYDRQISNFDLRCGESLADDFHSDKIIPKTFELSFFTSAANYSTSKQITRWLKPPIWVVNNNYSYSGSSKNVKQSDIDLMVNVIRNEVGALFYDNFTSNIIVGDVNVIGMTSDIEFESGYIWLTYAPMESGKTCKITLGTASSIATPGSKSYEISQVVASSIVINDLLIGSSGCKTVILHEIMHSVGFIGGHSPSLFSALNEPTLFYPSIQEIIRIFRLWI